VFWSLEDMAKDIVENLKAGKRKGFSAGVIKVGDGARTFLSAGASFSPERFIF